MPIGKKKENSFNRCQSEKKKTALIDANRKNSTIKRFGFPNDAIDWILRIRSLQFSTSPISNKMWATLFFREHFSFSPNILPKSRTLTHVIKADRTFVIWTQGSQHNVAKQQEVKRRQVTKIHQVNNEDSQLKKEKWYETIQNQLSHHKQDSEKEDKSNLIWIEPRIPKGRTWSI